MALKTAEQAEQEMKTNLTNLINEVGNVKLADLNNKFVVIKNITDSGDVYVDGADYPQFFAIVGGNVYHVTEQQFSDPTKGNLVITLDSVNKQVSYKADHKEDQPYESFNTLRQVKYYGEDGQALLQALKAHIVGTYNIHTYDAYLISVPELNADVKSNQPASGSSAPASSASQSASQPASSASTPASSASQPASSASSAVSSASQPASGSSAPASSAN